MWIPKWLGEVYSKLYVNFGMEPFTFENAKKIINKNDKWINVAFSKLHKHRILYIYKKSKPRLYRVIKPESFVLMSSGKIKNLEKIKQERYIQLICDTFLNLSKNFSLTSLCIYGSVARGKAKFNSDLDILIISDDFKGTLASRIDKLITIEEKVFDEIERLKRDGIYTSLSFLPLRKEEVTRFPLILLDLTEEGIIIYDEEFFLEKILVKLKAKLMELNARRIFIDEDTWYWDLKPDYKFGEIISI
jgi:predicted nucleotidyltransferase